MRRFSAPGVHDMVCRLLADQPGGRRVDTSTGTGSLVPSLLALGCSVEAVYLDPSTYTLSGPPCCVLGLTEPPPAADASVDVIVRLETLDYLPSPRHTIREFARVLRLRGCRERMYGFLWYALRAASYFVSYAKLWELQRASGEARPSASTPPGRDTLRAGPSPD